MGLRKRPAPDLLSTRIDAHWWGDEAVDEAASDIRLWNRSGGTQGLVFRPGVEPVQIRYRGLTDPELYTIPIGATNEESVARFYEAAKIGLISVRGEDLRRIRVNGALRLTDESLVALCDVKAAVPFNETLCVLQEAQGAPVEMSEQARAALVEVSLPVWVGVHILAASFRARRHAT